MTASTRDLERATAALIAFVVVSCGTTEQAEGPSVDASDAHVAVDSTDLVSIGDLAVPSDASDADGSSHEVDAVADVVVDLVADVAVDLVAEVRIDVATQDEGGIDEGGADDGDAVEIGVDEGAEDWDGASVDDPYDGYSYSYDAYCHYDCFGWADCVGGVATAWGNGAVECRHWSGSCPIEGRVECREGCSTHLTGSEYFDDLSPEWFNPRRLCEEGRWREIGDPCVTDADCADTRSNVSRREITNYYLDCDAETGTCVVGIEPAIPDYLAPCSVDLSDFPPFEGLVRDDACSAGVCIFEEADSAAACRPNGCTVPCQYDSDCPQGSGCSSGFYDRWAPAGTPRIARVCAPGAPRSEGGNLECPD